MSGLALAAAPPAAASLRHPLEPLTGEEIAAAVAVLRASGRLGEKARLVLATLDEPAKDLVLAWQPGADVPREVFLQILDNADGRVYEAVVSLSTDTVTRWITFPASSRPS